MKILLRFVFLCSVSGISLAQQAQAPKTLSDAQVKEIQHQALEVISEFGKRNGEQAGQEYVVPKGQFSDAQRAEINRQALETAEFAKRYFPR